MITAILDAHTYEHVMRILAPALALSFWAIVVFMALDGHRRQTWRKHALMWFWCVNVALWWTMGAFLRLTTGYNIPTITLSFWGTILFLQAAISLLAWFALSRNDTLPTGPPYTQPSEFGPDDD